MTYRRLLYVLLALGLLAALHVTERRDRQERAASSVEIVMDDGDFAFLARSYGYDQERFLADLKGAGLTSLAVSEELGAALPGSGHATAYTGGALLDAVRLGAVQDPIFVGLARTEALRDDNIYVVAYDAPTARRFGEQLRLKFPAPTVHVLRAALPAVWAVRTQNDYFGAVGLGLPEERVALAQRLGLHLVPRLQNDQTFDARTIEALIDSAVRNRDVTTAIFFGLRNEVLGYPDHLDVTANALRERRVNFGTIEVYDVKTLQAGNDDLARRMPARVVRVQAIGKTEQDKLRAEEIVARYLLGARERNVRVVYLRPFTHPWKGRDIAAANVALVSGIADGIRRSGLRVGRSEGFTRMAFAPWEIASVSLAVPAIVLLVAAAFGLAGWPWLIGAVVVDLLLVGTHFALHRDLIARQFLGLVAGIAFPTAALLAIGWAFRGEPPIAAPNANPYVRGLIVLIVATGVTLGGALIIVGLLSTPLTMTEVDRFAGVKYLLVLPALTGLAVYFFSPVLGAKIDRAAAAEAPVRWAQLIVGVVLLAGAYVVLSRSGNQTDLTPSNFELALRAHLTDLLSVRPRFKEFMVGFPAMMLLPALVPVDLRRWGWLFVLAIALGLADVVDTFCHLHTPLAISAVRVGIGALLGALVGAVAIAVYRRVRAR